MKFTSVLSLLSLFSMASADDYTFDCGSYGDGSIQISQGKMDFEVELSGLDEIATVGVDGKVSLGYHLHTIWINAADSSTGSTCGGSATGLHYDPTFKCGKASEAKDLAQCENADYSSCSSSAPQNCERGDLSSKYGALVSGTDFAAEKQVTGDNFGAKDQDFVLDNADKDPKKWSSIVFHDVNNSGARVLCCKIVQGTR